MPLFVWNLKQVDEITHLPAFIQCGQFVNTMYPFFVLCRL